jgi:hypothetical protein
MKLTQIEKIEQNRLRKKRADIYTVEVENEVTKESITVDLYANSSEDALILARRISKRSEKDMLQELSFDLREIKQNKLGLIFPWKDPVNQRSVKNAINMPLKRSKNMIRDIVSSTKGRNIIHVDELSADDISKMKTTNVKTNFVSLILFVVAIYIYFIGSGENTNYLSVALCLVVSVTSFIKTHKAKSIIETYEITNEHIRNSN